MNGSFYCARRKKVAHCRRPNPSRQILREKIERYIKFKAVECLLHRVILCFPYLHHLLPSVHNVKCINLSWFKFV